MNASDNQSAGTSVSGNGAVISGISGYNGFSYQNGVMTDLGPSHRTLVSQDGSTIIGDNLTEVGYRDEAHLVKFVGGVKTDLGTMGGNTITPQFVSSDGGTILGWSYVNGASDTHGFIYAAGHLTDLGDRSHFWPLAASRDGIIRIGHKAGLPLRQSGNTLQTLGMIGIWSNYGNAEVSALSGDGQRLAGSFAAADGSRHAYLFDVTH